MNHKQKPPPATIKIHHSPPRPKMPKEIKITPGTPDSIFSAVSGATGLPEHAHNNLMNNASAKSMFKSVLPDMASETEECSSMDRSTFTWSTQQYPNPNSNPNLNSGGSSGKEVNGNTLSCSGSTLFDDSSDVPSRSLFDSPPKKEGKEE